MSDTSSQRVGFVGLGTMGAPMTRRIADAGWTLAVYDTDAPRCSALAEEIGARNCRSLGEIGDASDIVITMLPNGSIVRDAAMENGFASVLANGAVVVDMSSSAPMGTRDLGAALAKTGIVLFDAPVSGGVRKAVDGSLAIMLGGDDTEALERVEPLLTCMGRIFPAGGLGAGHAIKALNNYISAAGLAAASEALIVARAFGVDPDVMVDIVNASTGRNNSTENKMKPFVIPGKYADAGFALDLMAKDVATAAELSAELGLDLPGLKVARDLWQAAKAELGTGRDHTEIHRYLAGHR